MEGRGGISQPVRGKSCALERKGEKGTIEKDGQTKKKEGEEKRTFFYGELREIFRFSK